jgi:hypothetical protein
MADEENPDRVSTWCLASFHTVILVVALVLVAYRTDALGPALTALSTLEGLLLFLGLWLTTWWSTRQAFKGRRLPSLGKAPARLLGRSVGWGGLNGAFFLVPLAVVLAFRFGPGFLLFILFALVAAVVGALVGGVVALIDLALIRLASKLSGWANTPT